ncbi:aspartyl/asparaginyl beta-hydroxylase domain-containing protein [Sandarakinorhabdus sp.]|uniref:aspartyl/asparaginyl beta-hydroxylase domain-containing protein n=1 Tax=Sandarakinorhabdus sp. TaxID=1916663 RepID=UPI00286D98F4|nr:aspartyl/asparaginyl beta-hydroxylase domain-containing protein [Sandarakinorhabdus sp.]
MRNFCLIESGIEPAPFLAEIAAQDDPFGAVTGRQAKIAVQREALAIPLRGVRKSALAGRDPRDVHESRWTSGAITYPLACAFIERIATALDSELSRAKIVCLPAGHRVYPHTDRGEYYRLRNRNHLVLKSSLGSWLRSGDEDVRMREGELWWFDNDQLHEAHNDGDEDRIHIIFDLLPRHRRAEI